jgi:hypothetical protein
MLLAVVTHIHLAQTAMNDARYNGAVFDTKGSYNDVGLHVCPNHTRPESVRSGGSAALSEALLFHSISLSPKSLLLSPHAWTGQFHVIRGTNRADPDWQELRHKVPILPCHAPHDAC